MHCPVPIVVVCELGLKSCPPLTAVCVGVGVGCWVGEELRGRVHGEGGAQGPRVNGGVAHPALQYMQYASSHSTNRR